jgi:hypothetical protein
MSGTETNWSETYHVGKEGHCSRYGMQNGILSEFQIGRYRSIHLVPFKVFMPDVVFKCEHAKTIAREIAGPLRSILEGTFGDQMPQPCGCVHYPSVNVRKLPDGGASINNGKNDGIDKMDIHQEDDAIKDLVQWLEADWPILQSNTPH